MKKIIFAASTLCMLLMPFAALAANDPSVCAQYNPPLVYDPTSGNCVTSSASTNAGNPGASSQPAATQNTGSGGSGAANSGTAAPTIPAPQSNTQQGSNLSYTPLEPIQNLTTSANGGQVNFPTLLNNLFNILIIIGALTAVLMLTVGGIQYMVSESLGNKKQGLARARAALWGILLVAGSWLILHTINPALLNFTLITCPTGANCTVTGAPANSSSQNGSTQQNLGTGTASTGNPFGFSSLNSCVLGTLTGLSSCNGQVVANALGCSTYNVTCLASQQYVTYDPNQMNTTAVQQAITNYTSDCSGAANLWSGNVKQLDGSLVGSPGQTLLVCAGPFQ